MAEARTEAQRQPTDFTHQFEVEFGYRFQLDLYAVANQAGPKGALQFDEQKVELRWALADWNKIPGNPTLYLEWNPRSNAPPHVEGKLLLGGQIASGWHWGSISSLNTKPEDCRRTRGNGLPASAIPIRDTKFSLGFETKLAFVNAKDEFGQRGPSEKGLGIGPSLQIRPLPPMHLDFAALFGTNDGFPRAQMFIVLGWEF